MTDIVRTFSAFLGEVDEGRLQADLTNEMTDLVAAMSNHAAEFGGKPKGKIVITLDLKLDGGVFEVAGEVKTTKPKTARARSIFWATPENHLSRMNPRQQQLPLRDVSLDRKEVI